MKSEAEVLELVRTIYSDIGGNPEALVSVRPAHGGWLNALMFEVVRNDNNTIRVARADIDLANRRSLTKTLRTFKQSTPQGNTAKLPLAQQKRQPKAASLAESRNASLQKEGANSRAQARLLLLCGSCAIERQHTVAIAKHTSASLTVTACCDACGATFQVVLSGGAQPGRTIADRLRRAISLSARHATSVPMESKARRPSLLRVEKRRRADG